MEFPLTKGEDNSRRLASSISLGILASAGWSISPRRGRQGRILPCSRHPLRHRADRDRPDTYFVRRDYSPASGRFCRPRFPRVWQRFSASRNRHASSIIDTLHTPNDLTRITPTSARRGTRSGMRQSRANDLVSNDQREKSDGSNGIYDRRLFKQLPHRIPRIPARDICSFN